MPIEGKGFEILIIRKSTQTGMVGSSRRTRTVGTYQVFHDGVEQTKLQGAMLEQKGPSDNSESGKTYDRRIEPGRYPLWTQDGTKYKTIGYKKTAAAATNFRLIPRPGIELKETGKRSEILIHPAQGFLSSEGCLHPSRPLASGRGRIDFVESRKRVIAIIEDLRALLGTKFPTRDGVRIPDAWAVVEDQL